ncbi:MAG TPA: MBL fold metallo-hydrolase [Pirellulaceae bacterium]|nr:MBL fold metallo-hydrolase [Pirellulaceae bacterium]
MLKNVPVKSGQFAGLTVEGYSRAAVQTYWHIPELNLGFDLGAHPWDFMGTPNWLISHCHLDHIAALPLYVARRRLMKMAPPRVILPKYAVSNVRRMLDSVAALDRGRLPCDLVGMEPGDRFDLSRELVVEACRMSHRIASLGFVVYDRRKKLKPEYAHLSGDQIRDLRLGGTEVTREVLIPLVGYTGDTAPEGLDDNPILYRAKILIMEMTFLADDHERNVIHKTGHTHLNDVVERADLFQNEWIIAGHFSTRYSRREAEAIVRRKLPDMLGGRLELWL